VCVTSPALAPWAQIPLALATGVSNAPPGAAELVKSAIALGADVDALSPIIAGLPALDGIEIPEQGALLKPRSEGIKAEKALVATLEEFGVKMSEWTPPFDMKPPTGNPSVAADGPLRLVAMRSIGKAKRGASFRARETDKVLPVPEGAPVAAIPTPCRASVGGAPQNEKDMEGKTRGKRASPAAPPQSEMEVEGKTRGTKRLFGKTRPVSTTRDGGDLD
jgi:hypothetical protein